MGIETPGLRESKKQETRQLISDHATRLFIEQGFEQTTIAEIAAAARVAKKTVTNYFPRKEDLALDHHEEFTASLARAVTGRADGESALAALRREFGTALERRDPVAGFAGPEFARMIADSPTLTARLRDLHDQREEALAAALADAAPDASPAIAPRAAAALLAAAQRLLFQRIQELTLAGHPNDRIAATVAPEAAHVFGLLADCLGDFPAATA
ncbi:TetR family transcriptional regulator [Streptomyces netropsis]|uniref:AcrR family transcriptional regulator n=1 Tax=Streptomyces netropsis TaxID=55404 RepID=A0A7W7LIE6_STRNE|nr:TetR family transcriptional regulator [Streptomyces netropsis]MBB4890790.1 AcrR family transcriptional regulator [Streptomyces netropsis]GGR51699.1 TetR family transcriptional regulator [Streptomyces netropsis]